MSRIVPCPVSPNVSAVIWARWRHGLADGLADDLGDVSEGIGARDPPMGFTSVLTMSGR